MRHWRTALVAVGIAALLASCDDDSGGKNRCGSASPLAIGTASDEVIAAGDCAAYEFTPEQDGPHLIAISAISSGDYLTLEFDADAWICSGAADAMTCAILRDTGDDTYENDLVAEDTYDFQLKEVSIVDTTFTILVTYEGT